MSELILSEFKQVEGLLAQMGELEILEMNILILKRKRESLQQSIAEDTELVIASMQSKNIDSITTSTHIITVKKPSTSRVVIERGTVLDKKLVRTKVLEEPNKEKIKVLLKEGEIIDGCYLEPSPPTLLVKELKTKEPPF